MSRRRHPFTAKEDEMLKSIVAEYGTQKWTLIAKKMPKRDAKQCRDRYNNYLAADFLTNEWTSEEDDKLKELMAVHQRKWVVISQLMGNRSANNIKNHWYKCLRKGTGRRGKVSRQETNAKYNDENDDGIKFEVLTLIEKDLALMLDPDEDVGKDTK